MVRMIRDLDELSRGKRVLVCIASAIIGIVITITSEQAAGIPIAATLRNIAFILVLSTAAGFTFVLVYKLTYRRQGKREIGL